MEKKKILLIASTPLKNDGLTKIEMDIIRTFKDQFSFEVACGFGFNNSYGDELKSYGIHCHDLPPKKHPFVYMSAINKLVKKGNYDTVYIHGNSAMMFLEAIPSKTARTRVVTHCHNTKSDYPLVHYIMKPIFNLFVDKKIGCSSLASKWAYCGKSILTIPNGIEIDRFRFDEEVRRKVRTELGWNDNKIVGHLGRLNKQKNHKKLIGIFYEMHKLDLSMRLLLIGDGELLDDIKKDVSLRGLEDAVKILGFTDRPQDYTQAMDVMVLPSLFEGLCLVAVEAQANGLPVLINNGFSPETSATEQAEAIDLSFPDVVWAEHAIELMNRGRKDVTEQIRNRNMDKSDMMSSIGKVLMG